MRAPASCLVPNWLLGIGVRAGPGGGRNLPEKRPPGGRNSADKCPLVCWVVFGGGGPGRKVQSPADSSGARSVTGVTVGAPQVSTCHRRRTNAVCPPDTSQLSGSWFLGRGMQAREPGQLSAPSCPHPPAGETRVPLFLPCPARGLDPNPAHERVLYASGPPHRTFQGAPNFWGVPPKVRPQSRSAGPKAPLLPSPAITHVHPCQRAYGSVCRRCCRCRKPPPASTLGRRTSAETLTELLPQTGRSSVHSPHHAPIVSKGDSRGIYGNLGETSAPATFGRLVHGPRNPPQSFESPTVSRPAGHA